MIKFFEFRGCVSPEEHTDATMDRVARKITEGLEVRTSNPYLYFHGVARNVLKEYLKERKTQQMQPGDLPVPSPASPGEPSQQLKCLERCLDRLPAGTQELIMQYYVGERRVKIENRNRLAEQRGVSLNALRIQAHRIRASLEACVEDCLKKWSAG